MYATRQTLSALYVACTFVAAPRLAAQGTFSGRAHQLQVRPPRLDETGLTVDGVLNEAQWQRAALLTGFSQFSPSDGVAAEDSTDVLVWYSPTAIYFGIRAFEKHGPPHATRADRDKIDSDDRVQLLLGTFNDGRQAMVFGVNPFGVQLDGMIVEAQGTQQSGGPAGVASARVPADLSPDFVFESKGRLTDYGYEVEVRIPFKSLRYQPAANQTWGFNVVRDVQHSGHEDSWAPARRASTSFLGQSGVLEGLTGLRRGLVLDVNPEATQRTSGLPGDPALGERGWRYAAGRPQVGANVRWGITNNLTLDGTANPDFSQIESDAGQLQFDPRQALFFPEKRPFFLDGIEQFSTPHSLIYTRRIVQPVGAAKLSGKLEGTNVAFLSALDASSASLSGTAHPVFNVLRVQRDMGAESKLGMAYTDRVDGSTSNRVADVDGSLHFGGIYAVQGQYAQSYTSLPGWAASAPLWNLSFNRNGKHVGLAYGIDATSEDFRALSGFIGRGGVTYGTLQQRFSAYGAPGSLVEAVTFTPAYYTTWRYRSLMHQGDALEKKFHTDVNATLRGGWNVGTGYFNESFGFDPALYANYRILGAAGDTLRFTGRPRIPNHEGYVSLNTPQWPLFSANVFYFLGHDENFFEWQSATLIIGTYGVTVRPTDKLRVNATYNLQRYIRRSDGSTVANNRIPRLKLEYQLARPVFLRLVGEYDSFFTDALRDDGRTGRPLLINGALAGARTTTTFRGDFLFSYQPTPGTVVFVGYGAGYLDAGARPAQFDFPRSLGFAGYQRTNDALFVKASYLFRL